MTNAGLVDVVVTEITFETSKVIGNEDDTSRTAFIDFSPGVQYDQTTISTMMVPHRLRYRESFKILFERKLLVRESAQIGGGTPLNKRPYCRDLVGNKHTLDYWISYQDGIKNAFAVGPSSGSVSEEEFE